MCISICRARFLWITIWDRSLVSSLAAGRLQKIGSVVYKRLTAILRDLVASGRELEKMDKKSDVATEPGFWGTLPKELLYLVFARLRVSGISRLRLLSKDWKEEVETPNSYFNRVLDETAYPGMFRLICWKDMGRKNEFCGWVFYVKSDRWHGIPVDAAGYEEVIPVGAADGGLLCFVSQATLASMFMIVMNPLTGKKVRLP